MLAPKFIMDEFAPGTTASVWFRNAGGQITAVRGRIVAWLNHDEELASYLVFELLIGSQLYLPYSDIYLSTLSEERWQEAQKESNLEDRAKALRNQMAEDQLRQQESGLTSPH